MEGVCVYLLLIHTIVQQKSKQHCKAIILQLKKKRILFGYVKCEMPSRQMEWLRTHLNISTWGQSISEFGMSLAIIGFAGHGT